MVVVNRHAQQGFSSPRAQALRGAYSVDKCNAQHLSSGPTLEQVLSNGRDAAGGRGHADVLGRVEALGSWAQKGCKALVLAQVAVVDDLDWQLHLRR